MELNRKNIRKIMLLITFTVLLFIGIEKIHVILLVIGNIIGLCYPFLMGAVFAFAINVPMRFYEGKLQQTRLGSSKFKHQRRGISFFLTLLTIFVILFIISFLVIPQLTKTISQLIERIPEYNEKIKGWAGDLSIRIPQFDEILTGFEMNWTSLAKKSWNLVQVSMGSMVGSTFGFISGVVNSVVSFFIAIVFACYILFQKEHLLVQSKKIFYAFLPAKKADAIMKICRLSDETFAKFLVGQCTEAIILGTMFVVTMLILRLPYAMLIGVLIAVLSLIPIVGAFIGCFVGAFLIVLVSPIKALIFIILFLVLQQIEGNLIYPHVVGSSVGLPSIWVLFAVTIGGKLMGIPGMIIGIPLVSVLYVIFAQYVNECLNKRKISPKKWEKESGKK